MTYEVLSAHKLKATKPRKLILEALDNAPHALNAEEVFDLIENSDTSLATVYRTLGTFVSHGILLEDVQPDGSKRYSLAKSHHSHNLRCTGCGKVIVLPSCPLMTFEQKVSEETGFSITGHSLEIQGICPDCQKECCGSSPC